LVSELERGQPADRILEYLCAHPIDLVVIPARGTWRPIHSVADRVLAEASCPVWLDRGAARSRATTGMDARRICCALELGECDESRLGTAANMAGRAGSQTEPNPHFSSPILSSIASDCGRTI
jgi:hypothetical protein